MSRESFPDAPALPNQAHMCGPYTAAGSGEACLVFRQKKRSGRAAYDGSMRKLTVNLTDDSARSLRQLARRRRCAQSQIVREAVAE
jgi:Ribbon-helix-helix protein, copG family